jgi:hypothetical protein
VLECEQGRCGGVVEVDPGEDTAAVADDRELSLAHRLDRPVVGSSVEAAVAQDDAAGPHDRAVEIRHCGRRLAHPVHRGGVKRIVLRLHGPALARVAPRAGAALGDEPARACLACGGDQVVGALGAQPVGLREAAIEVSGELHTSCPRSIN